MALALWLAGCAIAPTAPPSTVATLPDAAFELAGRLSARRGNDGAAAGFRWTHRPSRDELMLSTPLGAALARLEGDANEVRLALADGRTETASDWQALTARVLGAPVPVRGLAWWVRASPHPFTSHTAERDAQSRLSVLRQDGWEIVYDYAADASRPSRLRLSYPDTEVRLVLDAWGDAPQ
jgi:outer membrane lipoprotein LolB